MTDVDIGYLRAVDLDVAYRRGSLSPVEVVQAVLRHIERTEPKLNAMTLTTPEHAVAAARAAEERIGRGEAIGPLDGVPVTIKDLQHTRAFGSAARSRRRRSPRPARPHDRSGRPHAARLAGGGRLRGHTVELAALAGERSGLVGASRDTLMQLPSPPSPVLQIWWALPHFLRDDDASLFGSLDWPQALELALARAAPKVEGQTWAEMHATNLAHPRTSLFPQAASVLDPPGTPVGGDNDTVMANGAYPATGLRASYGAVARYVFDVGNWTRAAGSYSGARPATRTIRITPTSRRSGRGPR